MSALQRVTVYCHACGHEEDVLRASIENNEVPICQECGSYMSTTHWADDSNWQGFNRGEGTE